METCEILSGCSGFMLGRWMGWFAFFSASHNNLDRLFSRSIAAMHLFNYAERRAGKGTSRFVGVNLDSCATKTEALYEGRMRDCSSSRSVILTWMIPPKEGQFFVGVIGQKLGYGRCLVRLHPYRGAELMWASFSTRWESSTVDFLASYPPMTLIKKSSRSVNGLPLRRSLPS